MRMDGAMARRWTMAMSCVAACTGRPLVEIDDDSGADVSDTRASGAEPADDGVPDDDGDDDDGDASEGGGQDGDFTDTGAADDGAAEASSDETEGDGPVPCVEPYLPDVRVNVWPGVDPLAYSQVLRELDCVIEQRLVAGDGVSFQLACVDEGGGVAEAVIVGVEAAGISVPASLDVDAVVHARMYTGRDLDDIDEFPWRRADHFALWQDGVLVLGAGAGVAWPSTGAGEPFTDFWAPVELASLPGTCVAESIECHEPIRGTWSVSLGDDTKQSAAFSVVAIGDYDLHLGELVSDAAPQCGEPPYGWLAFAVARG
jgi:hypothetical protein